MDITINRIRLADPGQLFGIAGEIAKRFAGEGDYKGAIIAIGEAYDRARYLFDDGMSVPDYEKIIRMLQTDVEDLTYEMDMMLAHAKSVLDQAGELSHDLSCVHRRILRSAELLDLRPKQDPEDDQ